MPGSVKYLLVTHGVTCSLPYVCTCVVSCTLRGWLRGCSFCICTVSIICSWSDHVNGQISKTQKCLNSKSQLRNLRQIFFWLYAVRKQFDHVNRYNQVHLDAWWMIGLMTNSLVNDWVHDQQTRCEPNWQITVHDYLLFVMITFQALCPCHSSCLWNLWSWTVLLVLQVTSQGNSEYFVTPKPFI